MYHQLSNPMIDEASGLFSALGDASRLKILRSLLDSKEPLSQGAVADDRDAGLLQACGFETDPPAVRREPALPDAVIGIVENGSHLRGGASVTGPRAKCRGSVRRIP